MKYKLMFKKARIDQEELEQAVLNMDYYEFSDFIEKHIISVDTEEEDEMVELWEDYTIEEFHSGLIDLEWYELWNEEGDYEYGSLRYLYTYLVSEIDPNFNEEDIAFGIDAY